MSDEMHASQRVATMCGFVPNSNFDVATDETRGGTCNNYKSIGFQSDKLVVINILLPRENYYSTICRSIWACLDEKTDRPAVISKIITIV